MTKKLLVLAGVLLGILIVLGIVIKIVVDPEKYRPTIQSKLHDAIGRDVQIGKLSFSVLSGAVQAENISIADDPAFSKSPFITAKSLDVGVEILPLVFSRALRVKSITLDSPHVVILTNNAGKSNYSSLGPTAKPKQPESKPSESPEVSIAELRIKNGTIEMGHVPATIKPVVYSNVDLTAKDISPNSKMPLTVTANAPGGGKLKASGTVGPIATGDASLTPLQLDLTASDIEVAGVAPQTGVSGLANLTATLTSDGKQARSEGKGEIQKLKAAANGSPAPNPVALNYTTNYDLQSKTGTLQANVGAGKALANVSGTYDIRGETPTVALHVNAPNLPIDELQSLLPAFGVTMPSGASLQGGTLNTNLAVNGPVDRLIITGPVGVSNTKLAGFDLSSRMSAISSLAGLKTGSDTTIQSLTSNVSIAPELVRADAINLVIPALGQLTGAGTIADKALNFRMNARVQSTGTGLLGAAGARDIPFTVQGTTSNPTFVPDVGKMATGALMNELTKGKTGGQSTQGVTNAIEGLFGGKKKK